MENSQKWSAKDVITTVLFSVLLIVVQLAINMVSMLNDFVSMVLSLGISAFVCAPIYFLMVSKVNKRFVSFVYMTMLGIVFLIMGDWFLVPWFMILGILCSIILWKPDSCKNAKKVSAAWLVYSVLYLGVNVFPLLFFWDSFQSNALAMGMSQEYINAYVSYYENPLWVLCIIAITLVLGFLGCLVGQKLITKHFKKAGVL